MIRTPETPDPVHPLAAEAVSRLSDFALVQTLAYELGAEHNILGLEPIPAGGGVLYPAQSGIVTRFDADRAEKLRHDANGHLICKTDSGTMTAYADLVGLWPDGNKGRGEAALYRVQTDIRSHSTEQMRPFQEAVVQSLERRDGRSPYMYGLNYWPLEASTRDVIYARPQTWGNMLYALPDTTMQVQELGINELDKERGIKVSFAGPVKALLEPKHFVRITNDGVFATPDKSGVFEFAIRSDYPQNLSTPDLRVPLAAELSIDRASGRVVARSGDAEAENTDEERYNPRLHNDALFALVADSLPWQDITEAHLKDQYTPLLGAFDRDAPVLDDLLGKGHEAITARLRQRLSPQEVGCLPVAVLLGELPKQPVEGEPVHTAYRR